MKRSEKIRALLLSALLALCLAAGTGAGCSNTGDSGGSGEPTSLGENGEDSGGDIDPQCDLGDQGSRQEERAVPFGTARSAYTDRFRKGVRSSPAPARRAGRRGSWEDRPYCRGSTRW